jgi:hypothetical protein
MYLHTYNCCTFIFSICICIHTFTLIHTYIQLLHVHFQHLYLHTHIYIITYMYLHATAVRTFSAYVFVYLQGYQWYHSSYLWLCTRCISTIRTTYIHLHKNPCHHVYVCMRVSCCLEHILEDSSSLRSHLFLFLIYTHIVFSFYYKHIFVF